MPTAPASLDISADEIAAACLTRTAERQPAATRSVLLGVALVAAIQWQQPPSLWLAAFFVLRLVGLGYSHWMFRRVLRIGALAAVRQGLGRWLEFGYVVSGIAWGLLVHLVDRIGHWDVTDELTIILVVAVAVFMLITLSYQWRGMVTFNVGLWATILLDLLTRPAPIAWLIVAAVLVLMTVLLIYGRQLNEQAVSGIVADLENQRLARELAAANERLTASLQEATALSRRDPLTKVYNRRAFMEHVKLHSALMRRQRESSCVLMLDLDHFKVINDRYGHVTGDVVLEAVSAQLKEDLREIDVLARWGGEEFVILLPKSDLRAGLLVAERIRGRIEALSIPGGTAGVPVTVSIGVALWLHDDSFADAIRAADQALYAAKGEGRNRVEFAA